MIKRIEPIHIKAPDGSLTHEYEVELPHGYNKVTGVSIMGEDADGVRFDTFELDGSIVFPKRFYCEFFRTNEHVAPNARFYRINQAYNAGNLRFVFYKPSPAARNFTIYLRLENDQSLTNSKQSR